MDLSRDEVSKPSSGYTVVAILDDGAELNQAVSELQGLGIGGDDLTVILKREDPGEREPLPEGTRYIIVPGDYRGNSLAIGFAVVFLVSGLLFAFTTPQIGLILFIFFIALAAVLAAGSFTKVGVMPILIDVEAPAEESGFWDGEFEKGKVLVFASTFYRRTLKSASEVFERRGIYFDIIGRRLVPQPVNEAVLHRASADSSEVRAEEARGA
ncbi:MAG: hypothetical protein M3305_13750 [Actinomycetota bacterium]|nr:hypothetical protein [Actinomycetota bacterium]